MSQASFVSFFVRALSTFLILASSFAFAQRRAPIPSALQGRSQSSAPVTQAPVTQAPSSAATAGAATSSTGADVTAPGLPSGTVPVTVPGGALATTSEDPEEITTTDGPLTSFGNPLRLQKPAGVFVSIGTPAPAYLGGSFAYQVNAIVQGLTSFGSYWTGELTVRSFEVSARFQVLPTSLTPMFGAGLTYFMLSGKGSIQTLEASTLLGSLLFGVDWTFSSGLRVATGFTFHYPLRLNYPFVDVGWTF
jgi:hypothetical protein